jgi:hypothetical protein
MYKKTSLVIFSLVGLISLFLPYNKSIAIGCGLDGESSTYYYYDPFIKCLSDFFTLASFSYLDIFGFFLTILVIFSLVFSPVLLFFNRKNVSLVLIVLTVGLMIVSIYNSCDMLGYGCYVILFQQSVLLALTIIFKKQNITFTKKTDYGIE